MKTLTTELRKFLKPLVTKNIRIQQLDAKYPITLFSSCVPGQQIAKCNNVQVYEQQLAKHALLLENLRKNFIDIEKETILEDINDINENLNIYLRTTILKS